jgi:hypothetical protein
MNYMNFRMVVNEWYLPAFGTLAVSGASDWMRIAPFSTLQSIKVLFIPCVFVV